jgi:hypothetical protein
MLGYLLLFLGCSLVIVSPIIHVLTRIAEGIFYMSDAQTQALADIGAAAASAVTLLQKLAANAQPDDSVQIEAVAKSLNDAVNAINNPAPAPTPAPAPAPAPAADVPAAPVVAPATPAA